MPWYRVRLRIETTTPPSAEQFEALDAADALVRRRGNDLSVTLEAVDAGDPAGALARAMNVVLDHVTGETRAGEFELVDPPERPTLRRRQPRRSDRRMP